ncbi:hypothetical protein GYB61_07770 [bacterium]|nr:hypothetical protein [bacterium]
MFITRIKSLGLTVGVVCMAAASSVSADDIEIYLNPNLPAGSEPLVMFSIDYRPNLGSTVCSNVNSSGCTAATFFKNEGLGSDLPSSGALIFFDVIRLSLKLVFQRVSGVKVGLMINHNADNKCAGPLQERCSNGGYIMRGFESLEPGDPSGSAAEFVEILNNIPTPQGNQSHTYQGKELFFEFFRYLTSAPIYNAHNGFTDYGSKNSRQNLDKERPEIAWDSSIERNVPGFFVDRYVSPLENASSCTSIYTINMMFQVSNQEDNSDDAIVASKAEFGMGGINLQGRNNSFDTVIGYLQDADLADGSFPNIGAIDGVQNVTSYFVVDPSKINQTTTGYAKAGGTERPLPLADDPAVLVDALTSIFDQILSVSTTFVASSVPVNVFNRASVVDNVFLALFQAEKTPRWNGNLKKLRLQQATLADGTTSLLLGDALGRDAVSGDGRIDPNALTFWTDPNALPAADPDAGEVDGRDGRAVDRGAAGSRIPGFGRRNHPELTNGAPGARQVFFDNGNSLQALNVDDTTASLLRSTLGAADTDEAKELLMYIRGFDIDAFNNVDAPGTLSARDWIFGDPLHGRPLPINYGARGGFSASNPAIYIASTSNDGHVRMIRNTTTAGAQDGTEVWTFMPKAAMGIQKTLSENAAQSPPHVYGVDGAPVAITNDANGDGSISGTGEYAWLFFGMRRGGTSYFAMDVTDPENPKLKWEINRSSPGFSELGLTFSTPQKGNVIVNGNKTPVVVFAGGYDTNKDDRSTFPPAPDNFGKAIYVVNADTGALIWKAVDGTGIGSASSSVFVHSGMNHSIPSDVVAVNIDGDGANILDRILVGDTGGNVWRADLTTDDPSKWTIRKLAALGLDGVSGTPSRADDRRFFHPPDVVLSRDAIAAFDGVVIGSGDRANPLDRGAGGTPNNFTYLLKDRGATNVTFTHDQLADVSSNCLQSGTENSCGIDLKNGWKLGLQIGKGEKALSSPLTIANTILFTTFLPQDSTQATTCGPSEGGGAIYAVSLADATAVFNYNLTDDDPNDTSGEANSAADRFEVLKSGGIPAEAIFIPPGKILRPDLTIDDAPGKNRYRTYWQRTEEALN